MVLLFIQFGLAVTLLLFSVLIVWFEERSFSIDNRKWQTSTSQSHIHFSQIQSSNDGSLLSNLVHSAKFQPFCLVIITLSALYILLLLGYVLFKKRSNWLTVYQVIFGIGLLTLSYFPTVQYVFSRVFLASGLIFILLAQLSYLGIFCD